MGLELGSSLIEVQKADLKSVELLLDYTRFHIGVYLTLASSFIAVASLKRGEAFALPIHRGFAMGAILLFMGAGLAGGVIASTLTQCYGIDMQAPLTRCTSTREFLEMSTGPGNGEIISAKGREWIHMEHTAFWLGLASAFLAFLLPPKTSSRWKPPPVVVVQGSITTGNSKGAV